MTNEYDNEQHFEDDWSEDHRSGVIAVVGKPNAGKSTLINHILGQKIAIVTNKPQTTRKRQLGIYTREDAQVILVDTPGLHDPHNKLGEYMVRTAQDAVRDADLILWVVDSSSPPADAEKAIADKINQMKGETPVFIAFNKVDISQNPEAINESVATYQAWVEPVQIVAISAKQGLGIVELMDRMIAQLPYGPRYYPADQVSEANMRFIAGEFIREAIIENTAQEIPYSVAIEVEEYKERNDKLTYISAVIYTERDSQKGIIVGKQGAMIKKIGTDARRALAQALETKVFLDLRVKVLKDWRSNETFLKRVGYKLHEK
jgi:GTP-binding protein Era